MTPDSADAARPFGLAAILSITHSLPVTAPPHVELLEWITGHSIPGPVFALQYREMCTDWLLAAHPQLRDLTKPDFGKDDYDAQDAWVDEVAAQLGARILPVAPMPADWVRPDSIIDVLGDAGVLHKTYVVPDADPENGLTVAITTGIATREGTAADNADAARAHVLADGTIGAAVIDGIGHGPHTSATAPLLAEVAARISARRGPLPGILGAAELVADAGADGEEADAVAVALILRPGGRPARAAWVGDARAYGWNGTTLTLYTTDQTMGQWARIHDDVPIEIAAHHDAWVRVSMSRATVATVGEVGIDDRLIILTSDGIHDQIDPDELTALVREHETDPQALAEALVAAAQPDENGYRDDATTIVIAIT